MSVTSYAALFSGPDDGGLGLTSIEIPMIQRDYAQGREGQERIRREFITTLTAAVEPNATPVGLDFIYGNICGGVLQPLDGQQRLTALFLLHWYLAVRVGGTEAPWLNFAYQTRASARDFCKELRQAASPVVSIEIKPDFASQNPAEWIKDQRWFMAGWTDEPTISSMLVVLDYIHELLAGTDAVGALERLTDRLNPVIHFHVLNLTEFGLDDDIYVRMNSRGKPLTDFEIFKARFGAKLSAFSPERAGEFAEKIDGTWLDTFWTALTRSTAEPPAAAEVDAAILRYMRFLADFVDAREGSRIAEGDSESDVCLRVFGDEANHARLHWLFGAFDLWGMDSSSWFLTNFRDARVGVAESDARLPIFDPREEYGANLFLACCKDYSPKRHETTFPMRSALLLHAMLIGGRAADTVAMRRLRTVRNLADWSENEFRFENMGRIIKQTEDIMAGTMPAGAGFNAAQLENERQKKEVVEQSPCLEPVLQSLEDHNLLRGRLLAFSLDPETLPIHAAAFARTFGTHMNHDAVAAALLAAHDYTDRGYTVRSFAPARQHDPRWREVLTRPAVADALDAVLNCVSRSDQAPDKCLNTALVQPFITNRSCSQWFDWRYYFVAYPSMRESAQGCYSPGKTEDGVRMGYVVRRHHNLEWAYRDADPYLHAVYARVCTEVTEEWAARMNFEQTEQVQTGQWLRLGEAGITVASRDDGWRVYLADLKQAHGKVESVFAEFGLERCARDVEADGISIGAFWHLRVTQGGSVPEGIVPPTEREASLVDREDRISRAADFIKALLHATNEPCSAANGAGGAPADDATIIS